MHILTNQSLEKFPQHRDKIVLLPGHLHTEFYELVAQSKLGQAAALLYKNKVDPEKLTFCTPELLKLIDYLRNGLWGRWCLCCGSLEATSIDPNELIKTDKEDDKWPIVLSPTAEYIMIESII